MGQRLNIKLVGHNNEDLAMLYMHWSAYTNASYNEITKFLDAWNKTNPIDEDLLRFMYVARKLEYGMHYCDTKLPKTTCDLFYQKGNRNNGLFAISQDTDAFAEVSNWGDYNVEINFHDKLIINSVFDFYQNIDAYNAEVNKNEQIDKTSVPEIDATVDIFALKDYQNIASFITTLPEFFINGDGNLLRKII